MTNSDWITICVTLISVAFGTGVVITRIGNRIDGIEKELRKISRVLLKHHYRIKRLEKKRL